MTYEIHIVSEVIDEINSAFDWYESKQIGLGHKWLQSVEEAFERLKYNPTYYTAINSTYRRITTRTFPYLIIYEIDLNNIYIVGIRHGMQKPKF